MEQKIQLKHPGGKHAVRITQQQYDIISQSILRCLARQSLTHKSLLEAVNEDFKLHNIRFEGSVEWYMESVKLDLEANGRLIRIMDKPGAKPLFRIKQ